MKSKKIKFELLDKKELFKQRTILDQRKYYEKVLNDIRSDREKVKIARLGTPLYKTFCEEFSPTLKYAELKYGMGSEKIEFKLVDIQGQEINYDSEIIINGQVIERLEITNPLISKQRYIDAKQLNDKGITNPIVGDYFEDLKIIKENGKVDDIINKKIESKHYDNTVTLIIFFNEGNDLICFNDNEESLKIMNEFIELLRNKEYQFREVYLIKDLEGINNEEKLEKIQ